VLVESDADTHPSLEVLPAWWQDRAACVGVDPELFFPPLGHNGAEARAVCGKCPVLLQCRDYVDAMEEGLGRSYLFGIFAGETGADRWRRRRAGPI
jgi:WhiB family redox-sensing transcriptional regulator